MVAILYTQADVDQYKSDDFKATANRMGNGLLAKHDASGPPKEPAVYSARSGKLMDFSLNRERASQQDLIPMPCVVVACTQAIPAVLAPSGSSAHEMQC